MQRPSILFPSLTPITSSLIIRLHNRRAFLVRCATPTASPSLSPSGSDAFLISRLPLQRHPAQTQTMRHVVTSTSPLRQSGANAKLSSRKRFGSLATKAFVATATATTSYAAYYCVTALLFGSLATVSGDSSAGGKKSFNEEKKRDDKYGIEYTGFDSYPGIDLDDGTGDSTKEFKAASAVAVAKALDEAGLDETGMKKGVTVADGGDDTLHKAHAHRLGLGTCPLYGCPFLPMDVHYDEEVKLHLENMRKETSSDDDKSEHGNHHVMLKSSGSESAATLTLIGYKGGKLEEQINQDRALALDPYLYWNINSPSDGGNDGGPLGDARPLARLIGAFDGHAKRGEKVSEYVVKTLPALLGSKLAGYEETSADADPRKRDHDVGRILHETFLELDATSPAHPSGGCTASAVLQIGTRIYVANAGDSRSFIGVHIQPPSAQANGVDGDAKPVTAIVFGTREDKAHLDEERVRVEHMGGTVYLPNGFLDTGKGTTRVLYTDPTTGSTSGLAMSRSIGDWDASKVGVIPDPLIDILDTREIKKRVLEKLYEDCKDGSQEVEIDPASGEYLTSTSCAAYTESDLKVFAVSATDGLLDYLPEQAILSHAAKSLYDTKDGQKTSHPLLACEDLIYAAAQGWQESKKGRYRDDIAIAIVDLEMEQ